MSKPYLSDVFEDVAATSARATVAVIALVAATTDPWERFRAALVEHQDWHARPVSVSGFVGVSTDGAFFGGAHVDGEWWTDDESDQTDGHSVEEVIDGQIDRMRRWRQDRDVERMEWAAEDAAGGTE